MRDAALAAAAAAERRFDQDGPADFLGFCEQAGVGLVVAVIAGDDGDVRFARDVLGVAFVAHGADRFGRGADPDEAGVDHALREVRVFGEEAVAGVDGFGVRLLGGGEDRIDVQVGVARGRWADADGGVGFFDLERAFVGVGVDGDCAQAQRLRFADDADRDLAAVGDEDGGERAVRVHGFDAVWERGRPARSL